MPKLNKYKPIRILWILLGSLSIGMGVIGIFVPGWPTTIFLIIASYFYIRSSRRLYNWLINNRLLGIYIKNYLSGKGMPLKAKLVSLIVMWLFGLLSILMWIPNDLILIQSIVLLLLIIGTFFILRVKTSN
ncbi:MAG: YbaN family protein [Dehalococcoidia bacterium]